MNSQKPLRVGPKSQVVHGNEYLIERLEKHLGTKTVNSFGTNKVHEKMKAMRLRESELLMEPAPY